MIFKTLFINTNILKSNNLYQVRLSKKVLESLCIEFNYYLLFLY